MNERSELTDYYTEGMACMCPRPRPGYGRCSLKKDHRGDHEAWIGHFITPGNNDNMLADPWPNEADTPKPLLRIQLDRILGATA